MRRWLTVVTAGAVMLSACGLGSGGTIDAGPAPARSDQSTEQASAGPTSVSVFLTRGGSMEKVSRSIRPTPRVATEAMRSLLNGPSPDEVRAGLSTAIPADTRLLGLTIEDGTAKVDLSRDFQSVEGGVARILRLAQVTCTLDQFESVTAVRFALGGDAVSVVTGDGAAVRRLVTCDGYRRYLSPPARP
ncbi:MAG: GerMN domain-containing protein [Actinomycetota bacterium]|nr:GerMN domain-containing protein [Actinomycetota bacterium]